MKCQLRDPAMGVSPCTLPVSLSATLPGAALSLCSFLSICILQLSTGPSGPSLPRPPTQMAPWSLHSFSSHTQTIGLL